MYPSRPRCARPRHAGGRCSRDQLRCGPVPHGRPPKQLSLCGRSQQTRCWGRAGYGRSGTRFDASNGVSGMRGARVGVAPSVAARVLSTAPKSATGSAAARQVAADGDADGSGAERQQQQDARRGPRGAQAARCDRRRGGESRSGWSIDATCGGKLLSGRCACGAGDAVGSAGAHGEDGDPNVGRSGDVVAALVQARVADDPQRPASGSHAPRELDASAS